MADHHDFKTRVLVRSEDGMGDVGVVENRVPPRWEGPPLHHHAFDETFYVLEGELTFQLGDELSRAMAGDHVHAPADSVHTLANLTDAPARYLLVCAPGGFERYFDGLAAEAAGVEPPESASKPYPETIVVGPQIGKDGASGEA